MKPCLKLVVQNGTRTNNNYYLDKEHEMPKTDSTAASMQIDSTWNYLMQQPGGAYYKYRLDSMTLANNSGVADAQLRMAEANARNNTNNLVDIFPVFIPIIATVGILWVVYRSNEAKRAIKMALIEKGINASLLYEPVNENSRKYAALRYGLLLCGLGLGLIVGLVVTISSHIREDHAVWVTLASAILFGGLGMVIYHLMVKRTDQN